MKGKIDKDGNLLIWRKVKYKAACCPYCDIACGDWCSQFSEPILENKESTAIITCHFVLEFEKFEDERE